MNFPEKVGVTARLTIEYKAPTKADQVSLEAVVMGLDYVLTPPSSSSSVANSSSSKDVRRLLKVVSKTSTVPF